MEYKSYVFGGFFLGIGLAVISTPLLMILMDGGPEALMYLFAIPFPAMLIESSLNPLLCEGSACGVILIFLNGVFWMLALPLLVHLKYSLAR